MRVSRTPALARSASAVQVSVSAAVELTSDDLGEIKHAMSQIPVVGNRYWAVRSAGADKPTRNHRNTDGCGHDDRTITGSKFMTTINLQIGSKTFTVKLLNNASSRALLAMLPMTLTMIELNDNEKYYQMPHRLPTNSQDVRTIKTGDLMLYGSDTLVLFYESFTTPYRYTRLGYIEDVSGLANALGSGSVQVTFSLAL